MAESINKKYQCSVCGLFRDPDSGREFYEKGTKAEDISKLKIEIAELKQQLQKEVSNVDNGKNDGTGEGRGIIERLFGE